jgi:glycosyltransferase involved in cell wall biosynthesis
MKIGIITNLYPPFARGGAENVIVRTVGQLMALGHDVFVITGHPKHLGTRKVLDRSSTERIYRFYPRNLYFTLDDFKHRWITRLLWHIQDAASWHGAEHVRSILRDEQPDVVMTHNLKGIGLNIPSVIADLQVPHVHVVHDLQLIVPSGLMMFGQERQNLLERVAYAAYRFVCKQKFGNPDLVVFPSKYLKDVYDAHDFFPKSERVVMQNPAPNYAQNKRKGRAGGPLKLLFVGQLGYHKGLRFLLDALTRVKDDIRLYIAGAGPMKPEVEAAAGKDKRIVFLGYTPPEELTNVFGVVDALIVPSLCYENSPTVIYESLMAGVPVIASRIGGVGELITEGETGMLFTPGNEEDLKRVMQEMDRRKEEFAEKREEIRGSVEGYALETYAHKLVETLQNAIMHRNPPKEQIEN